MDFLAHSSDLALNSIAQAHQSSSNNRTPGKDLEQRLNRDYGPGNPFYEDFCSLVRTGIEEGWAASGELDGPKYRRGRVRVFILSLRVAQSEERPQSESQQMLIHPIHRYRLPPRPHSTCPSRQSSSTRRRSTQANTTSTRTARSTASCRSIRLSNWKACLSENTGRGRVGQVWRRARIIILELEVGGEWRFSFCRVEGLLMMRSQVSRSRRASELSCSMMAGSPFLVSLFGFSDCLFRSLVSSSWADPVLSPRCSSDTSL